LGFSLDEVRLLLTLADAKHCAETKRIAAAKLETVTGKLAALAACRKRSGKLVKPVPAAAVNGLRYACWISKARRATRRRRATGSPKLFEQTNHLGTATRIDVERDVAREQAGPRVSMRFYR
jgi:hypothetical protein